MQASCKTQTCILPFIYDNVTYTDCADIQGSERCRIPGGSMQQCMPLIRTPPEATPCGNARYYPGASPTAYSECVINGGLTFCRLKGREQYVQCPGAPR